MIAGHALVLEEHALVLEEHDLVLEEHDLAFGSQEAAEGCGQDWGESAAGMLERQHGQMAAARPRRVHPQHARGDFVIGTAMRDGGFHGDHR